VPESDRMSDKEFLASDALSASSSTHNLPSIAQSVLGATAAREGVSDDERLGWVEERQKLYLQLDDKVSSSKLYLQLDDKVNSSTVTAVTSSLMPVWNLVS